MSTGRNNQLTKQVGEYLVACELARRGLMVATFSGNVPDFDLIATDFNGLSCPIQVKTVKGGAWQFSIDKFVNISFIGKKQIVGVSIRQPIPHLICVFVIASSEYGKDHFFILEWSRVQDIIIRLYKSWLKRHGGIRPKKYDSLHCAIFEKDIHRYKDNWPLILSRFK